MMTESQRSIFRDKAIKHYLQNQEKTVLPRFISPPVILLLWCFLLLLLFSGSVAWFYRIPVYLTGIGEVGTDAEQVQQKIVIVVALPADQLHVLHTGLVTRLQIGQNGPQWEQEITTVEPDVLSPAEVRSRFRLDNVATLLVQQPSAVVLFNSTGLPTSVYTGSIVQVRIQIGSQRILSLLPGLNGLR